MKTSENHIDFPWIRWSGRQIAGTVMFIVSFVLIYWATFAWLVHIWRYDKEYSHGFLVPVVSIYLTWRKREYLLTRLAKPQTIAGGGIILASILLFFAGRAGAFVLAEAVSFLLLLPGIVLFIWGWERLKVLAMPLLYLQFMVPWAEEIIERIHPPFQYMSAWLGVLLLKATNVPILLDGKYIYLPNITLEVARECSGVRFLTSVIALGLPLVYLTQTKWKRAVPVLIFGVLITILVNGLRIALAGTMAYRYTPGLLHGPFHIFQGWFVAQVGFLALIFINWVVSKRSEPGACILCDRWKSSAWKDASSVPARKEGGKEKTAVLLFLYVIAAITYWRIDPVPVPLNPSGNYFPEVIGEWKGKDFDWIHGKEYFPGVDFQVTRRYADGKGSEIYYYYGYFEFQKEGKSVVSFHSNLLHETASIFDSDLKNGPPRIESSEIAINGIKYKVFSWYRLRSRYLIGRYSMKLWTIWDSLVYRRNNAAVFLVAVPVAKMKNSGDWGQTRLFVESVGNFLEKSTGNINQIR